jgi:hypothetical protein
MPTQNSQKRIVIRWTSLKGMAAIILFLIIAAFAEYFVVLYAINLGVKDETQLQWSFKFPGIEWTLPVVISPMFHLVPAAVIISLGFSWIYLTKHAAVKPVETQKGKAEIAAKRGQEQKLKTTKKSLSRIKSGLLKVKGIAYVWQKIHFARATIKSALTVLLVFFVFLILASLLTYPQLIYRIISGAYQDNPSLLSFVKGTTQYFASIGGIFAGVNNALLAVAPGFRDFAVTLGSVIKPLTDLDNAGKYLVFQNIAAWVSAMAVLFYGEFRRKGYRYKKVRRS